MVWIQLAQIGDRWWSSCEHGDTLGFCKMREYGLDSTGSDRGQVVEQL